MITKFDFSEMYYNDSGYRLGHETYDYFSITVKHIESWEIGDYVYYEDDKYTVMEREIKLEKGALVLLIN